MNISEKLRQKLKECFSEIPHIDDVNFYKGTKENNGINAKWFAVYHGEIIVYGDDSMIECVNKDIDCVLDKTLDKKIDKKICAYYVYVIRDWDIY